MRMPNLAGSNPNLAALMRRYLWTAGVVALLATIIGLLEGLGVSLLIPLLSVVSGRSIEHVHSGGVVAIIQHFAGRYSPGAEGTLYHWRYPGFRFTKGRISDCGKCFYLLG